MFNRVVFGIHPAGRVSPTAAKLDAITPEALVEFHRTHYVPDHAAIAFAGDISLAEARKLVEAKLGGWKKAGVATSAWSRIRPRSARRRCTSSPGRARCRRRCRVGTQSMTRTDPDYAALTVVNRVLGGTMGRLFRHLREEKGYTYGIGSGFSATQYRGLVDGVHERAHRRDRAGADRSAGRDRRAARQAGARRASSRTRSARSSAASRALENPQQVLGYYVDNWLYGLPADYWDTYPARSWR